MKEKDNKSDKPITKDQENSEENLKENKDFPIKTPETDALKNVAKETDGLNQAGTIKNTPPLN